METFLPNHDSIWFSVAFLDSLHGFDSYCGGVFLRVSELCHYMGGSAFFLGLISLTYLFLRPKLAFELALGLLTSGLFGSMAKFFLESPRPYPYPEAYQEQAFGLPSGHVYSSLVVWGLLFSRIQNRSFRIFASLVILIMPFSRMYLRVHYLGDVSLGFLLGILHLILLLWFLKRFYVSRSDAFLRTNQYRTYSLFAIVITLIPILWDSPFLSIEHHHSLSTALMSGGALAGFFIGVLFYPRFSKPEFFDWSLPRAQENWFLSYTFWLTIIIRILALGLIIGLFYIAPGILIKNTIYKDDLFLRYLRYLLVGFSIVVFVPILLQNYKKGIFLKA